MLAFTLNVTGVSAVQAAVPFADREVAALAEAAAAGDAARVQALATPARLRASGEQGVTLLQWALLHQNLAGFRALLQAGADPSQPGVGGATVVHQAAMAKDPAYLEALIRAGADIDVPHAATGATPLMSALLAQRPAQFALLLARHPALDRTDHQGNTALHVAAKLNQIDRVLDLLHAGANPVLRNAQGATFQTYLAMTPKTLLDAQAQAQRAQVQALLRQRGVALEL
jgi:ankyrin repeat protein